MSLRNQSRTAVQRHIKVLIACVIGLCVILPLPRTKADPTDPKAPVYAWTSDNIDVDALAARIKPNQDLYQKIKDEALAIYSKTHPAPHPYDAEAQKLIRLLCYLFVWGDFNREGIWDISFQELRKVKDAGATDPIIDLLTDINSDPTTRGFDPGALRQRAEAFAETSYPDVLKEWYYQTAIDKLVAAKTDSDGSMFADLLRKWSQLYRVLIKKPLPNPILYCVAHNVEVLVSDDNDKLDVYNKEMNQAFADAAPDSPVQAELDGRCLVDQAWIARSSDWASNVKSEQWAKFSDYLAKADTVLEAAYAKHPEETEISVLMLTVELGQGQGRDRMEQWFQRAIQADPQNVDAYTAKFWYLQPRWYGSEADLVSFGVQNQDLQDPPLRVLGAFGVAISQAGDQDQDIYKRADVWVPIEKNYRLLLARFPQSIFVRSAFAKHAADSGRWKFAKEQLDILGDNWDRSVFSQAEHARDVENANANPDQEGPSPENSPAPSNSGSLTFLATVWRIFRAFLPF